MLAEVMIFLTQPEKCVVVLDHGPITRLYVVNQELRAI